MISPLHQVKRITAYRRLLRETGDTTYHVTYVSDKKYRLLAQRLHAHVYLERQFVTPDLIDSLGKLSRQADPYQYHSDYFAVSYNKDGDSEVIATARQIKVVKRHGHAYLPTIGKLKLYDGVRATIEQIDPTKCIEISGLAKKSGHSSYAVLMLYRQMWHYSLLHGHKVWLMACDAKVYDQLKFLFGNALTQIGPETFYMGSTVVPAILEVDNSYTALHHETRTINPLERRFKKEIVSFFTRGLPASLLKKHRAYRYRATSRIYQGSQS